MPANIATTNGKPAFAYFGESPWHRLGQKLEAPATAAEAITAAEMNKRLDADGPIWNDNLKAAGIEPQ